MNIVKSYCLYLNSREANNGTPDNCNFVLTTPLTLSNSNNRFAISTPMIELPYSFSQVNNTNNILPYSYSDTRAGGHSYTDGTLTIPPGNYNINQLLTQLITSLIIDIYLRIPSSTLSTNNFLFQYNSQTGLVTFFMSATYTVTITFKFSISEVLGIMLGFPQVNETFGTAIKLFSINKVMCNPITSVYLRSDSFKFRDNYEAVITSWNNSDIVAKIPINTLPNSIIYYRNDVKSIVNNTSISIINLYLSDNISSTYSLNMNGVNYGCMIQIDEIEYKETNSYKDKIQLSSLAALPKELIDERDEIMKDLLLKKEKLEKEVEERKTKKKLEKTSETQISP